MANPIPMHNPQTGATTIGFVGFSWTCLFFGWFPALFRGHLSGFVVLLVLTPLTFGLAYLLSLFFYNKWHLNWLMSKGFVPIHGTVGVQANAQSQNIINVHVGDNLKQENSSSEVTLPKPSLSADSKQVQHIKKHNAPLLMDDAIR